MTVKLPKKRRPALPPNKVREDKRKKLQDLLNKITPENCYEEVRCGKPRGKEVW